MTDAVTIAAIQAAPVLLNREASTEKACRLIREAAQEGATLAAFSETWLPGYPVHAWEPMSGRLWWEAAADYIDQAVEIPGPTTERLCDAAREADMDVVIGVVERDPATAGTVYSTLLFIGREGVILGRHRKLKPTAAERIAWGEGDARGLRVYERPYGRLSGLNCWEHQMLLPGYVLMAQGTQIHVATWPGSEPEPPQAPEAMWARQHLLSRAFASQGACYVICASGVLRAEDVPAKYRSLLQPNYTGDSMIVDPRGEIIAGPVRGEEKILTARASLDVVRSAKAIVDVGGHYGRPDIFQLLVDGRKVGIPENSGGADAFSEDTRARRESGASVEGEATSFGSGTA